MSSLSSSKDFPNRQNSQFHKPFKARFKRWLHRRIPPQNKVTLNQHSIFIFPTRTGFVFLFLLLVLLLAAINYENSLIYALVFWLGSAFFVTIFYTYSNLSGITMELQSCDRGFVNEDIEFEIKVSCPEKTKREGIQLGWPNAVKQWAELYNTNSTLIHLFVNAKKRGWLTPGRVLIETYFPLGLLRAWSWVDLDAKAIIYPTPINHKTSQQDLDLNEDGEPSHLAGSDDFYGMRNYHHGDSPRHILWRSYARQDELLVKQFASSTDTKLILDWHQLSGGTELRLSRLAGMALLAHRNEKEFGLKLPNLEIQTNAGKAHLNKVLKELALYGYPH